MSMRSGKELILATKPFAKEIRSKSWFHTLIALGLTILALAGTVVMPWLARQDRVQPAWPDCYWYACL